MDFLSGALFTAQIVVIVLAFFMYGKSKEIKGKAEAWKEASEMLDDLKEKMIKEKVNELVGGLKKMAENICDECDEDCDDEVPEELKRAVAKAKREGKAFKFEVMDKEEAKKEMKDEEKK